MGITVVATTQSGANNGSVRLPTNIVAGDIIYVHVQSQNSYSEPPTGWTKLNFSQHDYAAYKVATGEESNQTLVFTNSSNSKHVHVLVFRGARYIKHGAYSSATSVSHDQKYAIVWGYDSSSQQGTRDGQFEGLNGYKLFWEIDQPANTSTTIYPANWSGTSFYFVMADGNLAPNTPIINNPKGTVSAPSTIATLTPLLDWSFSDPDVGDMQSKYQVRIKKASDNSLVHDSGLVTSQITDYQVPAGVLAQNTLYYWEVLTQDALGVASSYSSAEYFQVVPGVSVGDKYNFSYTGAAQPFVVPGNVTKVKVELWGAQGGGHAKAPAMVPGKGGYVVADLPVTPGETLQLYVGGKGLTGDLNNGGAGGWNGGGKGGNRSLGSESSGGGGGGGGGATDLRRGGTGLVNRALVAGGGAGAGSANNGGNGGGLVGEASPSGSSWGTGPTGGTQTAGGTGGSNTYPGQAGALGVGGTGANGYTGAGGGGAGFYGGGGGQAANDVVFAASGGGGSSYYGSLLNGSTTMGTRNGDGAVTITIIEATPTTTVVNRKPGINDSLNPEGSTPSPLFTWDFSEPSFVQTKYQIKIFALDTGLLTHDTGVISSTAKQHQLAAGILTSGKTYGWEITVQNASGLSVPSSRIYFITNRPPGAPTAVNPVDNYRTGLRPTFWATIGDDVEDNPQKFVIQIANDAGFASGVQERSTETSVGGWQAKTAAGVYTDMPVGGVDASFEGGTVKYTWSTDLIEGATYYWRMAGIDATTGSRGAWSVPRRVRVGNKITMMLKAPVETSESIERLLIRAQFKLATDGTNPATVKFEACNNAFDANPTWEDVTAAVVNDEYHNFTNHTKTASQWGLNLRIQFEANDSLEPIELYGLGISFD